MPCPICKRPRDAPDHRWCLVELFKTNKIQSVADWEELAKPITIKKGTIKVRVPKE
jgi:hypothetical protein